MPIKKYSTPVAFKDALEHRLKCGMRDSFNLQRERQLVIFDRFLARVVTEFGDAVVLKGGLVLELRLQSARTTKDIDLRVSAREFVFEWLTLDDCCEHARRFLDPVLGGERSMGWDPNTWAWRAV